MRHLFFIAKVTPVWRRSMSAACCLALANCASVTAVQRPVTLADLDKHVCPTSTQLKALPTDPAQRGSYRDGIVLECVKAINHKYAQFKDQLHQESTSINLFTDLMSQTLAAFASVDSGGSAKGLAASSALIAGGGRTINKNVFFDVALPALEASMDTVRARVLKNIIDAQNLDRDAILYTLERAGYDLDAYEAAGSLYAALSELTKNATQEAGVAAEDLALSQQGRIAPLTAITLLEDNIRARAKVLTDKVHALKDPADTAELDQLTQLLSVQTQPKDTFNTKMANVLVAIVNAVSMGDAAKRLENVAALETKLNPVLK